MFWRDCRSGGVTPACGYIGVGGALIIGVVLVWRACGALPCSNACCGWMTLRCLRCARRLWHCRLYHDRIFAASSLGGVGFAEGVTMGHSCWYSWKASPLRSSGPVWWLYWLQTGGSDGWSACAGRTRREGLDVNSHGENAYNA